MRPQPLDPWQRLRAIRLLEGFVRAQEVRCSWGLANQCGFVGEAYNVGLGVPRDPQRALKYFRRACDLGSQDDCVMTGVVSIGLGERHQVPDIVAMWERACESGSFSGCHAAGATLTLDPEGLGVAKDVAQGRIYLAKACAARYLPACGLEAHLIVQLKETANYERAQAQLVEACDLRERESCHFLARMELDGTFGRKDDSAAARHFWQACGSGWAPACRALAYLVANGIGVTKDLNKAKDLVAQACSRLGDKVACAALQHSNYDALAP